MFARRFMSTAGGDRTAAKSIEVLFMEINTQVGSSKAGATSQPIAASAKMVYRCL